MAEPGNLPIPERPRADSVPATLAAARERLIVRLTEAFASDELSVDEFERRLTAAYEAAGVDALTALMADLPSPVAELSSPAVVPVRITAVLSNLVRGGPQVVPERLAIRSWAGNVELDLVRAHLEPGVTEIALDVILGNVELRLPDQVQIENHSASMMGSFECRQRVAAGSALPAARPTAVIRFTGRILLGNVTVVLA